MKKKFISLRDEVDCCMGVGSAFTSFRPHTFESRSLLPVSVFYFFRQFQIKCRCD